MSARTTNIGICVCDLQRSLRFYCDGLGFQQTPSSFTLGAELADFTQLPGCKVTLQFIRNAGYEIELMQVDRPGPEGAGMPRPINTLGDVHLAVIVDDIDAAQERVRRLGGILAPETRMSLDLGDGQPGQYVWCFDPDGVRIELLTKEMEKVYQ